MSFRRSLCVALAFMKLHRRDCDHCCVDDCMGIVMRRLRELNEDAQRMSQEKTIYDVKKLKKGAA